MPIKIRKTLDGGILVLASGTINSEEIIEINQKIYETNDKIRAIKYQITDFTGVSNITYQDTDINRIANQDKHASDMNPDMLFAVVSDKDLLFGLSRVWEARSLIPFSNSRVFRKLEDAYRWIDEKLKAQ